MPMRKVRLVAGLIILVGLAVTACNPTPANQSGSPVPLVQQTVATIPDTPAAGAGEVAVTDPAFTQTAAGQSAPTNSAELETVEPATPSPQVTATEPPVTPVPRTELEATDPATVQLASGNVQLVEFFAFW